MLKDRIEDSLTFDDVLLLPGHSKLLPSEVSVKSRIIQTLGCNIPLLSATVDTVIEHQTAICMTKEAGIGSFGVIKEGGKDRYFQYHIEEEIKFVPEGIEGLLPYTGHLADSIY